MNSVELFAGAGGLSLGLEKAGWKSQLLIEYNKHACNTLRKNRDCGFLLAKDWNIFEGDVRRVDYNSIDSRIDLVAGGPPCQPFSLGGKHNGRNDSRDMFPEAIRAVRELGPKYFVFENVKGLLRKSFDSYFKYIILRLEFPFEGKRNSEDWEGHYSRLKNIKKGHVKFGSKYIYNVNFHLINAADYGIPQHRHRIIITGIREDLGWSFKFPEKTHFEDQLIIEKYINRNYWQSCGGDYIDDIDIYKGLSKRKNKLATSIQHSSFFKRRYKTLFEAIKDLPPPFKQFNANWPNHIFRDGARPYPGHTGSALHFPSKAIKAGTHGVPGGENMIAFTDGSYRYFTTREAARIQTFPDSYIFEGSWTESMRQIGNAVPVDLAFVIGDSLRKQIVTHEHEGKARKKAALQPT